MPGIFDDSNFSLLQTPEQLPSVLETIQRNRDPQVAGVMGAVPGPQLAQLDAQPIAGVGGSVTPQSMAGGPPAQQSGQPQPQPPAPASSGGKPEPSREQVLKELIDKTMKDLGKKDKLYGPDVFQGAGGNGTGLLGTGISPLSAILFGLGAIGTRRASPATAWGVSMKLAQLPQEYEHAQQQAAHQTVASLQGLLRTAQTESKLTEEEKARQEVAPIRSAILQQITNDLGQRGGAVAPAPTQGGPAIPNAVPTPPGTTYTPLQGAPEQISQAGGLPGAFAQATPDTGAPAAPAQPGAPARRLNYSMNLGNGLNISSPEAAPQQAGMSFEQLQQMHPNLNPQQAAILSRMPWNVQNAELTRMREAKAASDLSIATREILKGRGQDPATATAPQILSAHAQAQRELLAQAGQKVGVVEGAKFEAKDLQPPQVRQDEKYIRYNPQLGGVEYAPGDLTRGQLRAGGFSSVSGKQLEKVTAAEGINNTWAILKGRANEVSKIPAAKLWLSANSGGNIGGPEGANYKAALLDTTIQLDKLWGGVRGAASPSFREATIARFPQFIDHPEVVKAKTRMMDVVIDTLRDENIRSVTGAPQDPRMYQKIRDAMVNYDKDVGKAGAIPQAGGASGGGVTPPAGAKIRDYSDVGK